MTRRRNCWSWNARTATWRLKRTEEIWIEAYDAAWQKQGRAGAGADNLEVAAKLAGVKLIDGGLPESAADNQQLIDLYQAVIDAQTAQAEAQKKFNNANRLGISEDVLSYITESRELKDKLAKRRRKSPSWMFWRAGERG